MEEVEAPERLTARVCSWFGALVAAMNNCPYCGKNAQDEHSVEYVRADTLSQPNHEMKRCTKCGNLFRYPPSDNKPDATTCAWCSQPNQKCVKCQGEMDE